MSHHVCGSVIQAWLRPETFTKLRVRCQLTGISQLWAESASIVTHMVVGRIQLLTGYWTENLNSSEASFSGPLPRTAHNMATGFIRVNKPEEWQCGKDISHRLVQPNPGCNSPPLLPSSTSYEQVVRSSLCSRAWNYTNTWNKEAVTIVSHFRSCLLQR